MSVAQILSSSDSDQQKVHQLTKLVKEGPVDSSEAPQPYSSLIDVLNWEYSFKHSTPTSFPLTPALKSILKSNSSQYLDSYIRIKYNDLNGDYRYLVENHDNELNDFIGKKMVLVNSCPIEELTSQINNKLVELLVVANYDFKRVNVLHYLSRCEFKSPSHYSLFQLLKSGKIISRSQFDSLLQDPANEYRFLNYLDSDVLITNLTENNIVHLSKYYKSVKLSTISTLVGVPEIEDVLSDMIIRNKLPINTKIDQLQSAVIFGGAIKGDFNSRVSDIGILVNGIVLQM